MVDAREQYIASRAPRIKRQHPGRHAQALRTSGAGIVHREMMDLQRQSDLNKAETGRLKDLRRDWNRNRKYTDAGMALAGATTPMGAQDAFVRSTEDFRQLNKPAYNKMYPLTGNFMDITEKGGIWGALLSNLAKKTWKNRSALKELNPLSKILDPIKAAGSAILGGVGIGGAYNQEEATPEILQNYAANTFGYPYNVHEDEFTDTENWYDDRKDVVIPPLDNDYGAFTSLHPFDDSRREAAIMSQYPGKAVVSPPLGRPNIHEDEPWPYEDTEVIEEKFMAPPEDIIQTDPSADIIESDLPVESSPSPNIVDMDYWNWVDQFQDTHHPDGTPKSEPRVIPGRPITPLQEEVVVPDEPLPFNDARREAGIMSQHGQGPMWGSTEGTLRNQYLEHMKRGGEKMTYEEFERAWERMHALPRGLHFQEPRAGIR